MVKGCIRCWLTRIRSADLPRLAVIVAGKFEEQDHLWLPGNPEQISQASPPPVLRQPTASAARAAGSRRHRATAPQTPYSLSCPNGRDRPNSLRC